MAKDRITNVRIRFSKMIPLVYETFALPEDALLLAKFTETIRALSAEQSNDVAGPAKDLLIKIMNSTSKQNIFRWDVQTIQAKREEDRVKEDEEKAILTEWELLGGSDANKKLNRSGDSLIDSMTALVSSGSGGRPGPSKTSRSPAATNQPNPMATRKNSKPEGVSRLSTSVKAGSTLKKAPRSPLPGSKNAAAPTSPGIVKTVEVPEKLEKRSTIGSGARTSTTDAKIANKSMSLGRKKS